MRKKAILISASLRVRLADLAVRIVSQRSALIIKAARRHLGHSSSFLDMTPSLLVHLCKRADGRSVDGDSLHVEHRAVTGAIPARLKTVPVQVAANMGAACRVQVQNTGFVAIRRNLRQSTSHDPALAGLQIVQ